MQYKCTVFVRIKTSPTTKNKYLQIVKSFRKDGVPKQKVVASLGCIEKLIEKGQLKKIALELLEFCKNKPLLVEKENFQEIKRVIYGSFVCFRKVWEDLKIGEILHFLKGKKPRISIDIEKNVFLMVLQYLVKPLSKLSTYNNRYKLYGEYFLSLHHLYRTLDFLSQHKEDIEKELFSLNRNLFNNSCDCVFYDTTTLYFESRKESSLKRVGYSKDGKFNHPQIVLGLLIDKEARPFGFDVFGGNTFDGKTLPSILSSLKKKFNLERIVLVSDKAIFSEENLKLIEREGFEFIISISLKKMEEKKKQEVKDIKKYKVFKKDSDDEIFVYETVYKKKYRFISSYSKRRAKKDAYEREKAIEKIEKNLSKGISSFITNSFYKKFLKIENNKAGIDKDKVLEDSLWDGFFGVITNNKSLSSFQILSQYHNLWQIEDSFRVMKHIIEARPMFVWTDKRIKGHLVVCFLSFLLIRQLQNLLRRNGKDYSPQKIKEALSEVQLSQLLINNQPFLLRSPIEGIASDIFKTLKLKIPPNLWEGKLP